jgi:hypothetical protein
MKPPITRKSVFAICDELLLQDYFPDNQRLVSITGGTMATVGPLRDAWWSDLLARVEGSELLIQTMERSLHKDLSIREHVSARSQPAPPAFASDQQQREEPQHSQTRAARAEAYLTEERIRNRAQLREESDRHIALLATIVEIKNQGCEALRAGDRALLDLRQTELARLTAIIDELSHEVERLRARNTTGD